MRILSSIPMNSYIASHVAKHLTFHKKSMHCVCHKNISFEKKWEIVFVKFDR